MCGSAGRLWVRMATAVAVCAVLAGACGGSGGGHELTIEAVAAGTIAARTAHVEGTVSGTDAGEPVTATFSGDADFSRSASAVKLAYMGKDTPGNSEIVIFGHDVYLRSENASFGTKYLKFPSDSLFDKSGGAKSIGLGVMGFGVADPVGALRQLRSLATQVRDLGHEDVRGIDTSHERLIVKVTSLFPCPKEVDSTNSVKVCGPSAEHSAATIDAWIDDQSRMIRLETKIDIAGDAIESRVDYSRFGDTVDIRRPSKSEIVDLDSLLAAGADVGSAVEATGAWKTVASGTVGGTHWSLDSAPAQNAICLDFVTAPSVAMNTSALTPGPQVTRGGRDVPCMDAALVGVQQLVVTSSAEPGAKLSVVVGLAAGDTRSLVAHLADGSSQPVPIDTDTRSFVWVGARPAKLASLTAESADGQITCSDIATMSARGQPTGGAQSVTAPNLGYFCLPSVEWQNLLNQTATTAP